MWELQEMKGRQRHKQVLSFMNTWKQSNTVQLFTVQHTLLCVDAGKHGA